MQTSEKLLKLYADQVQDQAVVLLDAVGRILSWNPGAEQLYGHTSAEVVGQDFSQLAPEDQRPGYLALLKEAAQTGKAAAESWHLRKTGEQFWGQDLLTALRDENAQVVGYALTGRDITRQKESGDSIREAVQRFHLLMTGVQKKEKGKKRGGKKRDILLFG